VKERFRSFEKRWRLPEQNCRGRAAGSVKGASADVAEKTGVGGAEEREGKREGGGVWEMVTGVGAWPAPAARLGTGAN
jgi:hypothetical protein